MTEKQYGGMKGYGSKGFVVGNKNMNKDSKLAEKKENKKELTGLGDESYKNYKKAGKIASQVVNYAKTIIKKDMLLLDIAEKIEDKIIKLEGKCAFPVNLSINEIAAHYTPIVDDKTKANGLIKIDLGVHVNGCIADTAFSIDLENSKENKKIIEASEKALDEAIKTINKNIDISSIGDKIQKTITNFNLSPIINLSGHELSFYNIHAGITIPNYNNNNTNKLPVGFYAIEPFATNGEGKIYDSAKAGIYKLQELKQPRDKFAREIIDFIQEEYRTLPFCSRWIVNKFGKRALLSLSFLEQQGILHQYTHLTEKSHGIVSQAEHTIYFNGEKAEVLTA